MFSLAVTEVNFPFIRSILGVIGLLGITYLLSTDRKKINSRVVLGGLGLQLIIAFGVLKIQVIEDLFGWIAELFSVALQVSVDASAFVFGPLANFQKMDEIFAARICIRLHGITKHSFLFSYFFSSVLLRDTSVDCKGNGMGHEQDHAIIRC